MSNQPSTVENIRSTAASATQSVADTLNPSQNQESGVSSSNSKKIPQESSGDKSFKGQLDEAAYTHAHQGEDKKKESLVEKAVSYIPGMSSLLASHSEQGSEAEKKIEDTDLKFAPKRPENDLHVEGFLREQYKSKSGADMPDVKDGK